jgi:heme/copper-type cytochrome/quinol oxidase subunit 1
MTTIAPQAIVSRPSPVPEARKGARFLALIRRTDHKTIGLMYLVTSFLYFFAGGFVALLMRAELGRPGLQFLSPEHYNQLLTMHGLIMLLLFATPLVFAFANLPNTFPFVYNAWHSWRYGQLALRDDPWGHGNSLEWATSSPPPRHNFIALPRIRSERPAFEMHYPHLIDRLQAEAHTGGRHEPYASELVPGRARARSPRSRPDLSRGSDQGAGRRRRGPSGLRRA